MTLSLFEAFPGMYANHVVLGFNGFLVLFLSSSLSYLAYVWLGIPPKILGCMWTFVTYTAAIDTMLTAALVGYTKIGNFYNELGEKYVQTAAGGAIFCWDGTFHLAIQAILAWSVMTNRDTGLNFKIMALIWCGSIINSMQPYMLGAFSGPFSDQIQLSSALNAPYVIFPILVCNMIMNSFPSRARKVDAVLSTCFASFHLALAALHVVRMTAIMGSKTAVAQWLVSVEPVIVKDNTKHVVFQIQQWGWIFAPYHLTCAIDLIQRALGQSKPILQSRVSDWAALALGAYLQGTFVVAAAATFDFQELGKPLKWHAPAPSLEFWVVHGGTLVGCLAYLILVA